MQFADAVLMCCYCLLHVLLLLIFALSADTAADDVTAANTAAVDTEAADISEADTAKDNIPAADKAGDNIPAAASIPAATNILMAADI